MKYTFPKNNKVALKHGYHGTPTYNSWLGMRQRCYLKTSISYKKYGGRGIKVCKRWEKFENFLADMGERPEGKTLDRINNNGDYKPSNCRWATLSEQQRNKNKYEYPSVHKNSRNITFRGETKSLSEWARAIGITKGGLRNRLEKWDFESCFKDLP